MKKIKRGFTPHHAVQGFTLIELLVVVTILAILAVTVFVALNPAKRIKDAKDARRASDINSILTAIHEYIIDNKGSLPTGLTTTEVQLGTAASGCALTSGTCSTAAACVDMSTPLVKYLKTIPIDPDGTAASTGYSIVVDANSIVTVKACLVENSLSLTVSQ